MTSSNNQSRIVAEILGDKGGIGKTLLGTLLEGLLRRRGAEPALVRIDSQKVLSAAKPGVTHIYSERLAEAYELDGGNLAVFQSFTDLVTSHSGAVVIDYGAGLSEHRERLLRSTSFDTHLKEQGDQAIAFILVTRDVGVIQQAGKILEATAEAGPDVRSVLVINGIAGTFDVRSEIGAFGEAFKQHVKPHLTKTTMNMRLPIVPARAWHVFESAGLSMDRALTISRADLAKLIDRNVLFAGGLQAEFAAWHLAVEKELERVLRFQAADAAKAE
jgi:hypothetical protein